jgi:putative endonuclease
MAESHKFGQKGEELATEHLKTAGFKILHRNWKSGNKEIDIIAENPDFIVFVEVKSRSEDFLVGPVAAINREKRKYLIYAANTYLQRYGIDKQSRFDIITIIQTGDSFKIEHIEDAFYPTLR